MLILIEKDSSTRVPKECTPEQAAGYAEQFPVYVVNDDATTTPYADWKAAQEPQVGEQVAEPVQEPAMATPVTDPDA